MNGYNSRVQINEHIFRANDIRGVAYEDLTKEVVHLLGRSLGSETLSRGIDELIIGRDGRVSSPEIISTDIGPVIDEEAKDKINLEAIGLSHFFSKDELN